MGRRAVVVAGGRWWRRAGRLRPFRPTPLAGHPCRLSLARPRLLSLPLNWLRVSGTINLCEMLHSHGIFRWLFLFLEEKKPLSSPALSVLPKWAPVCLCGLISSVLSLDSLTMVQMGPSRTLVSPGLDFGHIISPNPLCIMLPPTNSS